MGILFACVSVHHWHAWSLWRSEEGTRCPGTRVTDWALNPGPLEEQQVLLATVTCPSPQMISFKSTCYLYSVSKETHVNIVNKD